jgi:hypothetical protein
MDLNMERRVYVVNRMGEVVDEGVYVGQDEGFYIVKVMFLSKDGLYEKNLKFMKHYFSLVKEDSWGRELE